MLRRPKNLLIVSLVSLAATSVGVGTVWSYLRAAHATLGDTIRDTMPITLDLKRLEQATDALIPDIRANQTVAAQLDVEIEYLEREIQAMSARQVEAKDEMQKLRSSLKEDRETYEFGDQQFSRREVENDLRRRLKRYDSTAVQLAAKKRILEKRRHTLEAACEKIQEYQHQQASLAQKADLLKEQLALVGPQSQTGGFEFNSGKLNEAKMLAERVEKRIRVLQKLVDGDREVSGEIPVDADTRPVTEEFDEYFGDDKAE